MRRENLQGNKMLTILFTVLIGIAFIFMGLDLDLQIVLSTMKVEYRIYNSKIHNNISIRNQLGLQLEWSASLS